MLQKEVQLWVAGRVHSSLKQWQKDVLQHLLEVGQLALGAVHVTAGKTGHKQMQGRQQDSKRQSCHEKHQPEPQWGKWDIRRDQAGQTVGWSGRPFLALSA